MNFYPQITAYYSSEIYGQARCRYHAVTGSSIDPRDKYTRTVHANICAYDAPLSIFDLDDPMDMPSYFFNRRSCRMAVVWDQREWWQLNDLDKHGRSTAPWRRVEVKDIEGLDS